MSSGKWKKGSKGTRGKSTGKNQKKQKCPWCQKPYKGKYLPEHQLKHCSKKPLALPSTEPSTSQSQPEPIVRFQSTVDHPKVETIKKDFIIESSTLNEILFSISCRQLCSVVLHFLGPCGSGKSYLAELIGTAMDFHTEILEADGFSSLAKVQRTLQSVVDFETPKRKLIGNFIPLYLVSSNFCLSCERN